MLKCGEVSHEDQKFTEIVARGTSKKGDHYIIPFPFRNPSLILPNNRNHVIQRLMGLKRRFMKDSKCFLDYPSFMGNLLRSGYAKRSDASPAGKTWYITHHGVSHSGKPGKIYIVFDCSAEFQPRKNHLQGGAIMTRFDKSDYWCLYKIS